LAQRQAQAVAPEPGPVLELPQERELASVPESALESALAQALEPESARALQELVPLALPERVQPVRVRAREQLPALGPEFLQALASPREAVHHLW
jgi:hypothetical protein